MHHGAQYGQTDMAKILLEAGANPNAVELNLQSQSMRAAEQGHVDCVRVLMEAGADIQLRNKDGQTVLQHHNSSVFRKNYASRYMPDTQAAYRGLEPQTALMRAPVG